VFAYLLISLALWIFSGLGTGFTWFAYMLRGAGIFTNICPNKITQNVGKYTIPGAWDSVRDFS
jgi:hypothetical protein